MKQKQYTPLHMLERNQMFYETDQNNTPFSAAFDNSEELSNYMNWITSNSFMRQNYTGPYTNINQRLLKVRTQQFSDIPYKQIRTEFRDLCVIPTMIQYWGLYRQAYRFDKDFTDELLQTESVKIPISIFKTLPYPCYYIDMEEDNRFAPFIGFFIYTSLDKETKLPNIAILRITKPLPGEEDEVVHSAYFDSKNLLESNMIAFENGEPFICFSQKHEVGNTHRTVMTFDKTPGQYDFEETFLHDFILFTLQTMFYLGSYKPDIQPTNKYIHKQTTKPTTKQTTSEQKNDIIVSDIGVRYGNTIRIRKKEIKKQTKNKQITTTASRTITSHMRAAHWHHYWTGPGRTKLIVKWIPPVFVCGGKELSVTIHSVK